MTTILVDADIVAYKCAAVNQQSFDWGDGEMSVTVDKDGAREDADKAIADYCVACDADKVLICLTDTVNFRKQLLDSYKGNRKNVKKPELLQWVKDYLAHEHPSFIRPRLEADDVMGILATSGDRFVKGKRIIVSEDKDMKTIPAYLYNPRRPEEGVVDTKHTDAVRYHLSQTLIGDATDGYTGCRGIGPKSPYNIALQDADLADLWGIVVEGYESKGFTEDDAIMQARMAYILWSRSYNFKTKKIKLWKPTDIVDSAAEFS